MLQLDCLESLRVPNVSVPESLHTLDHNSIDVFSQRFCSKHDI